MIIVSARRALSLLSRPQVSRAALPYSQRVALLHVIATCRSPKPDMKRFYSSSHDILKMAGKKNLVGVEYPAPFPPVVAEKNDSILDMFSLKGKIVSITGSSGDIGFEVARAFAQAGADGIAIWSNKNDPTEKIAELNACGCKNVRAYKARVDHYDEVKAAVDQQIKDFGRIDVMVANAGVIWTKGKILDEPDNKEWDRVTRINYDGVYNCAKAVGYHFRERGKGNLIITGSMSGHIVNVPDTMPAYTAGKAAVIHLGKALALEWAEFARVNIVSPGYVATVMTDEKQETGAENWGFLTPMGRMGHPRELAGAYLYFASDASTFATGTDLVVDGGYILK